MSEALPARKTIVGRNAASAAVLEIAYDAAVVAVDELIEAPDTTEFVSPGFIDLQVNGFAGVAGVARLYPGFGARRSRGECRPH